MKKTVSLLLSLAALLLLLSGCTQGNPLPQGLTESSLMGAAREVIALLDDGQWQQVYDLLREDARQTTSPQDIESYMTELTEKTGAYVQERDYIVTGQTLKDSGEEYGTAVIFCKHEKKNVMYRFAYSADLELLGFQAKKN